MAFLTLGDLINSRIPGLIGECTTAGSSSRTEFIRIVNEAQQRMITGGKWWGTVQKYKFCCSKGCIVLPRQVAAVEAFIIDVVPHKVRDFWFEFLESGEGLLNDKRGSTQLIDQGQTSTFDEFDLDGNDKYVRVRTDVTEAAGAYIILRGYDANDLWIRTDDGAGGYIDGEKILLTSTGPIQSTNTFTAITEILKPATLGVVRISQWDPLTASEKNLGVYEPDETHPKWRKVLIPNLEDWIPADQSTVTVTLGIKLDHIPVALNDDPLIIQSLPAFKEMMHSIKLAEARDYNGAEAAEARAFRELEKELSHHRGTGAVIPMRFESQTWGAGNLEDVK